MKIKPPFSKKNSRTIPISKYDSFKTISWLKDQQRTLKFFATDNLYRNANFWDFLKASLYDAQTWALLFIIGVLIGLTSSFLFIATAWLSDIKRGYCKTHWYLSKDLCCQELSRNGDFCADYQPFFESNFLNLIIFILFSFLMAISSSIMSLQNKYIPGSGLSELKSILGGFVITNFLSMKMLIFKSVSLPLSIGSGFILGKEGPILHLATAISNSICPFFSKYASNEGKKREAYAAACAAAVACAFGAPISGILISLEGFSSFFSTQTVVQSFFCALISSATVQLIDPYRGNRILFQTSYSIRSFYYFETMFYIPLGALGGLFGSFFIRSHRKIAALRSNLSFLQKFNPVVQAAVIIIITSAISFPNRFTRVDGSELLESLIQECDQNEHLGLCNRDKYLVISLFWSLIVKTTLGIISYGALVPGGYLLPSMCIGALLGRIVGECVAYLQVSFPNAYMFLECPKNELCIIPGVYSLLGALSVLCGFTKLTVSLTVLLFELTGTLNYILPCMITLLSTKLIGDWLEQDGFLESIIALRGYPFLDPQKDYSFPVCVRDKMTTSADLVVLTKEMDLRQIQNILDNYSFQGFPLVSDRTSMNLLGYIDRLDLQEALLKLKNSSDFRADSFVISFEEEGENSLFSIVDDAPLCVDPGTNMNFILDLFRKLGPRMLLVNSMDALVGLITKKDLLDFIEEAEKFRTNQIMPLQHRESGPYISSLNPTDRPFDIGYDLDEFRFRHFSVEDERELLE